LTNSTQKHVETLLQALCTCILFMFNFFVIGFKTIPVSDIIYPKNNLKNERSFSIS